MCCQYAMSHHQNDVVTDQQRNVLTLLIDGSTEQSQQLYELLERQSIAITKHPLAASSVWIIQLNTASQLYG